MDSRLTTVILWSLVGLICVSYSQDQEDLNLADVFCTCMPYHKCKKNSTQVTTEVEAIPGTSEGNEFGEELIDIRFGYNEADSRGNQTNDNRFGESDSLASDNRITPEEGKCKHYLEKCCFPATIEPVTATPPTPPPTGNPTPLPTPANPQQSPCGARQPNGVGFRITGNKDNEANYGEFPWMVAVLRQDKVIDNITLKLMECGGSIIHSQVVLTAAHCVKGKTNLSIRAGEWDTQTNKEEYPTQDREVKEVIIHEEYLVGKGERNDIALLILDKPLELNQVVGTLCLPVQDENMDNRNCVVSGWGKDVFGKKGKYQVIMKRVEKPVVQHEPCQKALRKTRLGSRFSLHESFICAGGEVGKDACKGDGGGPLACPSKKDNSVYVQAGIVSWGIGCGTETPAVYVNVAHFINWIEDKMSKYNFV